MNETAVKQHTRLAHCDNYAGALNWINNTGVFFNENGQPVRCGLANESSSENKNVKSSDLIGITPTLITGDMVGYWFGVFTALEIKHSDWTPPNPTNQVAYAHYTAQARFHDIVRGACGYAGFVTNPATDLPRIIGR